VKKSNSDIEIIKKEIVNRLKMLKPKKIILFGSFASGNPDENSDLDICVVGSDGLHKMDRKKAIRKLLSDFNIAKDILTPSEKEFEFYKNEFGSVYMDIHKKGEVLWTNS